MKFVSTLSIKGQLTLPLEVPTRLGLETGDRIEFLIEDGKTILRPVRSGESRSRLTWGSWERFPGDKDEINAWIGELRDDDSLRPWEQRSIQTSFQRFGQANPSDPTLLSY